MVDKDLVEEYRVLTHHVQRWDERQDREWESLALLRKEDRRTLIVVCLVILCLFGVQQWQISRLEERTRAKVEEMGAEW